MKKNKATIVNKPRKELIPKKLQHEIAIFFARRGINNTSIALRNILVAVLADTDQDELPENGIRIYRDLLRLMDKVHGMLPERSVHEAFEISDAGKYYPGIHEDGFDDGYDE